MLSDQARPPWGIFLATSALTLSCGGSAASSVPPVAYTGTLPATLPALYLSNVLTVQAGVNGTSLRPIVVDTGSPMTGIDPASYADAQIPSDGSLIASLAVGGLTFSKVPSVALSECGASCGPFDVTGVLGGNVLRSFVVSFDYQGAAVLFGQTAPPASVDSTPFRVAMSVQGGGMGTIAGGNGEEVDVPPTRVVMSAVLEGTRRTFVLDTGASYTLLRQSLFDSLTADGRATLMLASASATGGAEGAVARSRSLTVGGAASTGSPIAAVSDAMIANLASETGTSIDGLLGGSFLRSYDCVVDYAGGALSLYPYVTSDPLADEFVRVGVFLAAAGSGYAIGDVISGTAAASVSGLAGAVLVDVDGTSPDGLNPEAADRLLRGAAGTSHILHVQIGDAVSAFTLPVTDVLPL